MGAISKLRMLANEIDWNVYDNGGIPYDLRKVADEIEAENEKLREKCYEYESKMDGLVCKLTGGFLSKSTTLSNDALYAVVEELMTEELVDENFKLELENSKLRELVRKYGEYTNQDRCEGCACKSRCDDGDVDECWQLTEIRELARELGMGIDR